MTNVPGGSGPFTAVVADCNQGVSPWPHQVLFIGPGPKFVASSDLYDANWKTHGLTAPARSDVESMTKTKTGLSVNVSAERLNDASCYPGGSATVTVKVAGGKVVITSIKRR